MPKYFNSSTQDTPSPHSDICEQELQTYFCQQQDRLAISLSLLQFLQLPKGFNPKAHIAK